MSALATTADRLRAELAAKPRLRLGVWVIVAIVLGYIAFPVQSGRVDRVASEYAVADRLLVRAEHLLARRDWSDRLDAARTAGAALAENFWQADNEGLAQARLRTALEALVQEARLGDARIELGLSRPVADAGLWQIQARVTATARRGAELSLLHAIATHPRKISEQRLQITRRADGSRETRIEALLSAFFFLADAEPSRTAPTDS